jgi:hypothetical protein
MLRNNRGGVGAATTGQKVFLRERIFTDARISF